MNRSQYILLGASIITVVGLFFWGNKIPPKKAVETPSTPSAISKTIQTEQLLAHARERLTPYQLEKVTKLENSINRGDVKTQKIKVYTQLAGYWRDTVRLFEPYVYYTGETAKLENSEKSLTFAAHLYLNNMQAESDPAMQNWLASNAKVLFDQALSINPANDSSIVGLGACYILGNVSDNPMQGISSIRGVLQKDPDNVFAHWILGLGGIKSGQIDKAISHFKTVVKQQPKNVEALLNLAESLDRHGDKSEAIQYYKEVKKLINNAEAQQELDKRIKAIE